MDTQEQSMTNLLLRLEETSEDEPASEQHYSTPTGGNSLENTDITEPAVLMLAMEDTVYPDLQTPRHDMTYNEERHYSQFILHDIQSELYEGDTLVFVDFPTHSEPSAGVDCYLYAWNSVHFRMHSQKLLDTGSSKFSEMLNPTYQFRVQRRRKLVDKLPEGIKYVLDLTPPSEGDELVFQMTEASLTPGIIKWWTAHDKYGIDAYVVFGHDDVCSCWREVTPKPVEDPEIADGKNSATDADRNQKQKTDLAAYDIFGLNPDPDKGTEQADSQNFQLDIKPHYTRPKQASNTGLAAKVLKKKSEGDFTSELGPTYRQIPDYCPVRHRVDILRLMCLIAGKRVIVDSAPLVWTLVAVAKILDCTSVLRDPVLQWIMSPNNTVFIEVLPEESLQIGVALKLDQITRSAFRILVNELALEEAARPNGTPKAAAYTVFGRRRHDPGDDLNNLIQHAARAMVERVSGLVNRLVSETIFDDMQNHEWLRLQNLISMLSNYPDDKFFQMAKYHALVLANFLRNTWKSIVVHDLLQKPLDPLLLRNADDHRATYVDVRHFDPLEAVYRRFNNVQKALCSFVYEAVGVQWSSIACVFSLGTQCRRFESMVNVLRSALEGLVRNHPELGQDPACRGLLNLPQTVFDAISAKTCPNTIYDSSRAAFDSVAFEVSIHDFLVPFHQECTRDDFEIKMEVTPHLLLNLHHNELKFLPLWAGGNDDGTGGVFEDSLPPADYGPDGPGPVYHTGVTIPSDASSTSGSISSVLGHLRLEGGSTIGPRSIDVQDGISTVFNPARVVADDRSIRTESFTDGESEYHNARYAVPADGQSIADAFSAAVLDEAPDQSDSGASVNFEENDDTDEAMTEVGPDESRSREETPEYVVASSEARGMPMPGGGPSSTAPSTEDATSSSLFDDEDDDDVVMV
ncbi:hypothetical protein CGRA01v4_08724 [Colletotrichum graminicola]|uniref:Uncharacterized protein n=1 Tax=Colletotrichum graminicola (strain M1.001 / M2 / FGSC 10212) TaxID=645133 RepID=E3QQT4_COLGM|nr:uncharacterized protein GLRG_08366 [Colletotrichum graminicola M1.001]EFQ33222.1 hypothetical protein GLRG_08366 [Colletotrichum graminicola M1.001]WDK17441.1 hypothetical protein CGRA01v4_08724 [Colletotrichum graminicola]